MKLLASLLLVTLSMHVLAGQIQVEVDPSLNKLYEVAIGQVKHDLAAAGMVTEVYPQGFQAQMVTGQLGTDVCNQLNGRKEFLVNLQFRDENAHLREASYLVCSSGPGDPSPVVAKTQNDGSQVKMELHLHTMTKEFTDGRSTEDGKCDQAIDTVQEVCLPEGFHILHWDGPNVTSRVGNSQITETPRVDPAKPNCLLVPIRVEAQGYANVIGNLNYCVGGGSLFYVGTLFGYSNTAIKPQNPTP